MVLEMMDFRMPHSIQVAITKCHTLNGLNNRNVFFKILEELESPKSSASKETEGGRERRETKRERKRINSLVSLIKSLIPLNKGPTLVT